MRAARDCRVAVALFWFALVLLCAPGRGALAQDELRAHTISVVGEAQINAVPDKVSITLGVESVSASVLPAKNANDASVARVLTALRGFGVETKDVQTDHISIEPRYDKEQTEKIVGYTVRKSMVVTLRDTGKFDAVLSAAVNGGANVVQGVQFTTTDLRKYRDQARTLAIKAAREKADALATAVGQKAAKAITITEQQESSWSSYNQGWNRSNEFAQSQNVLRSGGAEAPSESGSGETTAPGETRVRATVQVTFQLLD